MAFQDGNSIGLFVDYRAHHHRSAIGFEKIGEQTYVSTVRSDDRVHKITEYANFAVRERVLAATEYGREILKRLTVVDGL